MNGCVERNGGEPVVGILTFSGPAKFDQLSMPCTGKVASLGWLIWISFLLYVFLYLLGVNWLFYVIFFSKGIQNNPPKSIGSHSKSSDVSSYDGGASTGSLSARGGGGGGGGGLKASDIVAEVSLPFSVLTALNDVKVDDFSVAYCGVDLSLWVSLLHFFPLHSRLITVQVLPWAVEKLILALLSLS